MALTGRDGVRLTDHATLRYEVPEGCTLCPDCEGSGCRNCQAAGIVMTAAAGKKLEQATDVVREAVRDLLPAGRAEFLRRYRGQRRSGVSPYTAMVTIRGTSASGWLREPQICRPGDVLDLAVCVAADEYISSRLAMPGYWWRP